MAKVGILTFSNTLNYGAALQCYALSTYLTSLGNEVYVIDYRNQKIEINGKRRIQYIHTPKQFFLWLMTKTNFSIREKLFDDFNQQFLPMTSILTKDELANKVKEYDAIIVGSDQVWNGVLTGCDSTYFLPFQNVNVKKISYAASFGRGIPNDDEWKKIKVYLSQFYRISVRENNAAEIIRKKAGIECQIVCDPTFLIGSETWAKLANQGKCRNDEYVLCYVLSHRELVISEGKKIAHNLNLPLICLQTGTIHSTSNAEDVTTASPLDFLALFKKAKYIITDSFHGTCFSIIFQKNFNSILGNSEGANARIKTLLDRLGLSEQYKNNCNGVIDIDYSKVKIKQEQMVKLSQDFIKKTLE